MRRTLTASLALLALSTSVTRDAMAAEHFVAPSGTPSGDGSEANPWDLQTALDHPSAIQPGDTIWLLGGTYAGTFTSSLTGSAAAPIVVRQKQGERATIDGGNSAGAAILSVGGSYTWFWGFEIMSSDPVRTTQQTGSSPTDIGRGTGVNTVQSAGAAQGVKFINLIVHDTAQGLSFWKDSTDSEIYGCLIYYNGWDAPDRGHGHGVYTQNDSGKKTLSDNILFDQFGYGIHAYGSDNAFLKNFTLRGNVSFDNGVLAQLDPGLNANILVGGESGPNGNSVLSGIEIADNATYSSPDGSALGGSNNVGYSAGCSAQVSISNNVFAQGTPLALVSCDVASITGNTFIGAVSGFSESSHPTNSYQPSPPSENLAIVRPNLYEPGRAHIIVYNWQSLPSVAVDVSPAQLTSGAQYRVHDAQNFFADPIASGVFAGSSITIPMQNLSKAAPVGTATPAHSAPRFGAFVLLFEPGNAGGAAGAAGAASGASAGASGASAGASGGPNASDSGDEGGCGCRTHKPKADLLGLLALALFVFGARRRAG